mmetsp:Transcript_24340/g.37513  ORF Transcript_24340/g.37513 Transcript_24340/m.37513 type:complete len:513 (-) Transcript_24340:149-1687(-)
MNNSKTRSPSRHNQRQITPTNQTSLLLSAAFPNYRSLYKILNTPDTSTKEEIRDAYFQRALQCRTTSTSDKHAVEAATLRLKAVHAAYEILSNPVHRSRYNRLGEIYDVVAVADDSDGKNGVVGEDQQKMENIMRDLIKDDDEFAPIVGELAVGIRVGTENKQKNNVVVDHRAPSPFDDSSFFHLSSPSNVSGEDSDTDYINLADKVRIEPDAATRAARGLFLCGGLPVVNPEDQVTIGDTVNAYKRAFDEAVQDIYDEAIGSLKDYESAVDQVIKAFAISDSDVDALLENIAEAKETSLAPFECGGIVDNENIEVTLSDDDGDGYNKFRVTEQLSGEISDAQHDDDNKRVLWTKESSDARKQRTKATPSTNSSRSKPIIVDDDGSDSAVMAKPDPKQPSTPSRPPKYPMNLPHYHQRRNDNEYGDGDVILDNSPPMARVGRNRIQVQHVIELPITQEIDCGKGEDASSATPSSADDLFDKYSSASEPGKMSLLHMRIKEASLSPGRSKGGK